MCLRTTKTLAECQAEQAGQAEGRGAETGAMGGTQAQIASFAFARTQDKAQEGTEAAAEAEGREATTSTMTMRMKQ